LAPPSAPPSARCASCAPGPLAAAKGGDVDDEEGGELCAVCLCNYEDDDVLIQLPCEHLFHESCISRWLSQDSSCPQCRFNLLAHPAPPAADGRRPPARQGPETPDAGTELTGRPIGSRQSPAVDAPSASASTPPAADPNAPARFVDV